MNQSQNQNEVEAIVEFCSGLISNERIGSRYEGNNIDKLWLLGDKIISSMNPLDLSSLLPKLSKIHENKKIRYDDRLYRAAITFRKYWNEEQDYKKAIIYLNVWTKLRELYPICDGLLKEKSGHTREEVDTLIKNCQDKTYTEVREVFIKFRKKDDVLLKELGIDSYEFTDSLIDIADELQKIIENNNSVSENKLRNLYTTENFREFRLLLSALQKEDVYQNKKWKDEIKKIVKKKIPDADFKLGKEISSIFRIINKFINNDKARHEIRKSIPIVFIGNFSTLLRAIESDANKIQYKKNKDILVRFMGNMGS
jgi:hypothetical protein